MTPQYTFKGKYTPTELSAINFKMLNRDATYKEVASAIGVSESTIKKMRLNSLIAEIEVDFLDFIIDAIGISVLDAVQVLKCQLQSEDERVAQSAAKDILDRFMGKPTQRQEITGKDGNAIETKGMYEVIDYRKTAAPLLTDEEDE